MRILSLDTSTLAGSIALTEDNQLRAEITLNLKRKHTERLLPSLDWLFSELGLSPEEIDLLGVGIGPGSFTGLRVGLATAKGLALSLNLPLLGISSLLALAWQARFWSGKILALLDARKGQVFAQMFQGGGKLEPVFEPISIYPAQLAERIKETVLVVGEGFRVYSEIFSQKKNLIYAGEEFDYPRAEIIARLAYERFQKGERDSLDELVPLYLRPSDAELKIIQGK